MFGDALSGSVTDYRFTVTDVLRLVLGVDVADICGRVGMRVICSCLLAMSENCSDALA